ncbi:hypothetical protein GCM10009564_25520 [Streptomyces thermogriseus]|uniref:Polymorphic outer membrane protein n=2 Tax=Streptomyces thermogriseus TaxID=75292 RepID=A0ABN1SZG7_9ACTN
MFTRAFSVRTAHVLCIGMTATLAPLALAPSASAKTHTVACSQAALRTAITTANSTPGTDTLKLTARCTYALTSELPSITSPIVINGNHATITRTAGSFRILTVDGGNLTLRTTTIANGDAAGSAVLSSDGGGILVTGNGTLTVDCSVIRDNTAAFGGGIGVASGSQAHVSESVVRDNSSTQNGGGLVNNGTLTVRSSQISRNTAGGAGGGIASIGTLTITTSNLVDNTAQTGGGIATGVPTVPGGTTTVSFSNVSQNQAANNNPGGIYNNNGIVTLQSTVVAGNTPNNCSTSPSPVPGCAG